VHDLEDLLVALPRLDVDDAVEVDDALPRGEAREIVLTLAGRRSLVTGGARREGANGPQPQ
jgi:hypothetical protein